jgi:hypothetical protein
MPTWPCNLCFWYQALDGLKYQATFLSEARNAVLPSRRERTTLCRYAAHPLGGLLLLLDAAAEKTSLLLLLLQDGVVLIAMLAHSLLSVAAGEDAACVALRRCLTAASVRAAQHEHGN